MARKKRPGWQCMSCGGVYVSPQGNTPYYHQCPAIPDPDEPIPGEDEPDMRHFIPWPCERNEHTQKGREREDFPGKALGRGRRAVADVENPPPLPPPAQRPCKNPAETEPE